MSRKRCLFKWLPPPLQVASGAPGFTGVPKLKSHPNCIWRGPEQATHLVIVLYNNYSETTENVNFFSINRRDTCLLFSTANFHILYIFYCWNLKNASWALCSSVSIQNFPSVRGQEMVKLYWIIVHIFVSKMGQGVPSATFAFSPSASFSWDHAYYTMARVLAWPVVWTLRLFTFLITCQVHVVPRV